MFLLQSLSTKWNVVGLAIMWEILTYFDKLFSLVKSNFITLVANCLLSRDGSFSPFPSLGASHFKNSSFSQVSSGIMASYMNKGYFFGGVSVSIATLNLTMTGPLLKDILSIKSQPLLLRNMFMVTLLE